MAALQTQFDFARARPEPRPQTPVARLVPVAPVGEMAGPAAQRADHAQGAHPPRFTRSSLEAALQAGFPETLSLVITDNERSMISTRRHPGERRVRLHHMFLSVDRPTLRALRGYLDRSDPQAGDVLGRFIAQHRTAIRRKVPRRVRVQPDGRHHDLQATFERLNADYFDGKVEAQITWARRGSAQGPRRRSIKLGSYNSRDALIRVHPVLDAGWVPHFFVAYIVYHEMLHQVVPPKVAGGRRQLHGPEFCAAERAFAQYEDAIAWERANLRRLLRA